MMKLQILNVVCITNVQMVPFVLSAMENLHPYYSICWHQPLDEKTFLFSITLFYLLPNRRGKFSEGSAFPCQQNWICFSMTAMQFCDCNRCKMISNTWLWDIIYNISGVEHTAFKYVLIYFRNMLLFQNLGYT